MYWVSRATGVVLNESPPEVEEATRWICDLSCAEKPLNTSADFKRETNGPLPEELESPQMFLWMSPATSSTDTPRSRPASIKRGN
jgi:hypothetical protein